MRETGVRERKVETAPIQNDLEDRNLDHAVFRTWCSRCVKGRTETCGRRKKGGETGDVPTVSLDDMYTRSEQEKEEETGMPAVVVKDNKTKMAMAKVVPSAGVQEYAVEVATKFVEQLGYNKVIMKSDSEPRF